MPSSEGGEEKKKVAPYCFGLPGVEAVPNDISASNWDSGAGSARGRKQGGGGHRNYERAKPTTNKMGPRETG